MKAAHRRWRRRLRPQVRLARAGRALRAGPPRRPRPALRLHGPGEPPHGGAARRAAAPDALAGSVPGQRRVPGGRGLVRGRAAPAPERLGAVMTRVGAIYVWPEPTQKAQGLGGKFIF